MDKGTRDVVESGISSSASLRSTHVSDFSGTHHEKTSQRIIIDAHQPQSPESLTSTRFCLGIVLELFEDSLQVLG